MEKIREIEDLRGREVAGYKIIRFISFNNSTIMVLGKKDNEEEYATWEYNHRSQFYWGHYGYKTREAALIDLYERAKEECILVTYKTEK